MTLSQAIRAPRARRVNHRPARAHRAAVRRADVRAASWEIRSFVLVSGGIAAAFFLVLLYLSLATTVSAAGYEAQRLAAVRDEVRRQNALLEIESARLDSPSRIEADAQRIGLVRASVIQVVPAEAIAAKR